MKSCPTLFRTSLWLLPALSLALAALPAAAQNTNAILSTNDLLQAIQAEAMENGDAGAMTDLTATNDVSETNGVTDNAMSDTNGIATPAPDGRMRRLERQRQLRRRSSTPLDSSQTTNAPSGPPSLDYSAFRLITDRNIFDPNRMPHSPGARPAPKVLDSFTLVGTLSYGKGDFAFFDGSSSEFQKVLKPNDTIAGYQVLSVSADSVKLARGTNQLTLPVGSQLRRQEDGAWVQVAAAGSYTASNATSNSSTQTAAAPSGPDSDVLKRLMQRRAKE